jgi:hypothetical protein
MADPPATGVPGTLVRGDYSPDRQVFFQQTQAKKSLVVLGAFLIVLFLAGVVLTRVVGNTADTVGTRTTTKVFVSDTVLTAILSTGVFILLIGLLYSRITAIKLPGGAEIDLRPQEEHLLRAKVKETIVTHDDLDRQDLGSLLSEARHFAIAQKVDTGTFLLSEHDIDQAVKQATVAYTKS